MKREHCVKHPKLSTQMTHIKVVALTKQTQTSRDQPGKATRVAKIISVKLKSRMIRQNVQLDYISG